MDRIRILPIVENKVYLPQLTAQHGLSLWIEWRGMKILFDFGQDKDVFMHNAQILGVDVKKADMFVLSHGHYDHSAGLKALIKQPGKKRHLFLGKGALVRRFRDKKGENPIGSGLSLSDLTSSFIVNEVKDVVNPVEGIFLGGNIPRRNKFKIKMRRYYKQSMEGEIEVDDFSDEIAMYIVSEKGLIVITGCSHRGILNIIDYGVSISGVKKIDAVIGGFHLSAVDMESMSNMAKALRRYKIRRLMPMHCVALDELCMLKKAFPENMELVSCGKEVFI